jgi:WD40 repeat protein
MCTCFLDSASASTHVEFFFVGGGQTHVTFAYEQLHQLPVTTVVGSADGMLLATASADSVVRLWSKEVSGESSTADYFLTLQT